MSDSTYWLPIAAFLTSSLGSISGVEGVVEGNLPTNPKLSNLKARVAYFYRTSTIEPAARANGISRAVLPPKYEVVVGIAAWSTAQDGSYVSGTASMLKDWIDGKWETDPSFGGLIKGFARVDKQVTNNSRYPYTEQKLEISA